MKIHKLSATFGSLSNETLELVDGLNIICAPNESGKSTWCAFIKAMLYGIDSSAREKGGVKPDKVRFAPWSGAPMAGTMEIEYGGKEITLSRQGRESAPMRDFSATYTGSAAAVKNISSTAVGETLLGVSRDVFERTAFIGQGRMVTGGSPELEKRISAIVATGEETSSVGEAEDRLRAALRRRRYNRSGRLPEIERELEELREKLSESESELKKGEELKKARREALERRDALLDRVAESRKSARRDSLDRLSFSRNSLKAAEDEYREAKALFDEADRRMDEGVFGREDPKKCRQKLAVDKKKLDCLEKERTHGGSPALNIAILAALLIAAALTVVFSWYIPAALLAALAIAQGFRLAAMKRDSERIDHEKSVVYSEYRCLTVDGMEQALEEYEGLFEKYGVLAERLRQAEVRLGEANLRQAELEGAIMKELDFSDGRGEASSYTKLLEDAETALRAVREESAAWEGRQSLMKDPYELKARIGELSSEHEKLEKEFSALTLALKTLSEAGEEISHRITPRLSQRASELFGRLTASGYDTILLDRELKAAAKPSGDALARDSAFLSAGTLDQLYLAVRLAICELALPAEKCSPIILDDALVSFDDERCRAALGLLRELAVDRQILLFTCHGREALFMRDFPDVFVTDGKPRRV